MLFFPASREPIMLKARSVQCSAITYVILIKISFTSTAFNLTIVTEETASQKAIELGYVNLLTQTGIHESNDRCLHIRGHTYHIASWLYCKPASIKTIILAPFDFPRGL
jgi:hypothetical protein